MARINRNRERKRSKTLDIKLWRKEDSILNKRQKQKMRKKRILFLANDGREFKSEEAKRRWIKDTYDGWGTAYTKYHLKGYPESPFQNVF